MLSKAYKKSLSISINQNVEKHINTNLPSDSMLPNVKAIPNLIGLKKTSIDCCIQTNKMQISAYKKTINSVLSKC